MGNSQGLLSSELDWTWVSVFPLPLWNPGPQHFHLNSFKFFFLPSTHHPPNLAPWWSWGNPQKPSPAVHAPLISPALGISPYRAPGPFLTARTSSILLPRLKFSAPTSLNTSLFFLSPRGLCWVPSILHYTTIHTPSYNCLLCTIWSSACPIAT